MLETKTTYDAVVAQHEELRGMIAELRNYLQDPRPSVEESVSHTWAASLAERLLRLRSTLFVHFREEEQTGFLRDLRRRFPRASAAISTMRKEHDWFLEDLGSLLSATIVYSEGRLPENPNLRKWTESLLERLENHERQETELFQRLIYEDLGTGD